MELKLMDSPFSLCRLRVLIVPLWNWNLSAREGQNTYALVLIVPLWNWNCTSLVSWRNSLYRLNRTIMELKCERQSGGVEFAGVLIVPLWNWNLSCRCLMMVATVSLNRTIMELKSLKIGQGRREVICLNRTIMELK